jgi:hypothetical protein
MTSDDVTPVQVRQLQDRVARRLRFLNRLVARMNALGFPPEDPLIRGAVKARNAMQDQHMGCHYASVKQGVGR